MKILIVDNEKLIVDDLVHEVTKLWPNASVNGVTTASDALKLAEITEYNVALLDIVMPDMNGLTLAKRLISSAPAINIIFITGYAEYALDALELYCSGFITKPIGTHKLQEAFANLRHPFIDVSADLIYNHYSGGAVIGKKLELCRKQKNITRQELADLMKVSRQTIYRWEHGERVPDILTFIKLTRLLGIRIEDVIGGNR